MGYSREGLDDLWGTGGGVGGGKGQESTKRCKRKSEGIRVGELRVPGREKISLNDYWRRSNTQGGFVRRCNRDGRRGRQKRSERVGLIERGKSPGATHGTPRGCSPLNVTVYFNPFAAALAFAMVTPCLLIVDLLLEMVPLPPPGLPRIRRVFNTGKVARNMAKEGRKWETQASKKSFILHS